MTSASEALLASAGFLQGICFVDFGMGIGAKMSWSLLCPMAILNGSGEVLAIIALTLPLYSAKGYIDTTK